MSADRKQRPSWRRFGLDWIEAAAAYAATGLMRCLPLRAASAIMGTVGRLIGPRLGVSCRADANLQHVMPDLSTAQRRAIIASAWDNFGRTSVEFTQLERYRRAIGTEIFQLQGGEHVEAAQRDGKPILFVSGHFGNWEVLGVLAKHYGMELIQVYRPANNPLVDRLWHKLRAPATTKLAPKGPAGTRKVLRAARLGEPYGMLVDQKLNEGISVPFLGVPANTTPMAAQIALRYGYVILPAFGLRVDGCCIKAVIEPPISIPKSGSEDEKVRAVTIAINQVLERWIRAYPGQWLWLHRRWGKL